MVSMIDRLARWLGQPASHRFVILCICGTLGSLGMLVGIVTGPRGR